MDDKTIILDAIKQEITQIYGYNCYLSRKYIIKDKLDNLIPSKPEDNTTGFIAYDVPNKARMKMKTTRFLTRKLNLNSGFLHDKLISNIANTINNDLFGNDGVEIKLLKGQEITKAYEDEIGSSSCMTGNNADYTRLYEFNPDRFSMLVMFYQNDSARAIVSKLDNGKYYMDRVYASCCYLEDKMTQYAINNGWLYRSHNSPGFEGAKNGNCGDLIVSNLAYEDGNIPYMDTFKNGCTCGNGLTISTDGCCDYSLEETTGYLEGEYSCDNCGCHVHEDNLCYAEDSYFCENCYSDLFTFCENCGESVYNENIITVDDGNSYYCQYCIDNGRVDVYCCEDCNKYYSDSVCIEDERWICESCADSTDYGQCEDCGQYFYAENLTEVDNCLYCEDCKPEDNPDDYTYCEDTRDYISCKTDDTKELF